MESRERWKALLERGGSCPDPEEIFSLLHGEAPKESRSRLEAHVKACARCSTRVTLYHDEFESLSARPDEQADVNWISERLRIRAPEIFAREESGGLVPERARILSFDFRRFFSLRGLPAMGVAAAVLLLSAGLYLMTRTAPEIDIPIIRNPGSEVRSAQVEVVSPAGEVDEVPLDLRWKASREAARYQARVFEVDQVELWRGETEGTRITLPRDVRERIVPGKKLLWEVSAVDAANRKIASSGAIAFRMSPVSRPSPLRR